MHFQYSKKNIIGADFYRRFCDIVIQFSVYTHLIMIFTVKHYGNASYFVSLTSLRDARYDP